MYTTKWFAKDFVMQKHALFKSWFDDVIVPMSVRNNSTLYVQLQQYRFISIQRELQRNNTPSLHISPLLLNRSKLVLTLPSKHQTLQPLAPLKGFFLAVSGLLWKTRPFATFARITQITWQFIALIMFANFAANWDMWTSTVLIWYAPKNRRFLPMRLKRKIMRMVSRYTKSYHLLSFLFETEEMPDTKIGTSCKEKKN